MEQYDRVFISIQFIIVVIFLGCISIDLSNQNKELGKKIDIIIENQKSSVATPTPQKDVE